MINFIFLFIFFTLFFFSSFSLTVPTIGFLLIFSSLYSKIETVRSRYLLFYVFFIFCYVLLLLNYFNFTLNFLILAVVYGTILVIFFIFTLSFEDLKKSKEWFGPSIFFSLPLFLFFFLLLSESRYDLDYSHFLSSKMDYTLFYRYAFTTEFNEFYILHFILYLHNNVIIFFFFFTLLIICFSISSLLSKGSKFKSYK